MRVLAPLKERAAAASDVVLDASLTGDSQLRLQVQADGKMILGSGSAVGDVASYRVSAGLARIDVSPGNTAGGLLVALTAPGTTAVNLTGAQNDGSARAYFLVSSTTYTTSGLRVANQGLVFTDNVASMLVGTTSAADIIFASGGTAAGNERMRIVDSTGKVTFAAGATVPDDAYDATTWNGNNDAPTKNAIRDTLTTTALGVVNHGSTAGTARPSGYAAIQWIGSVEPTNAINGDLWVDTS